MPLNGIIPLAALQSETIWADAARYQDAERQYYEVLSRGRLGNQAARNNSNNSSVGNQQAQEQATSTSSLASEIAHARQKIQNFLKSGEYESDNLGLVKRVQSLELENKQMQQTISELCTKVALLETKVDDCVKVRQKQNSESKSTQRQSENTNTKPSVNGPTDDDDDIDLFGSDEETEEELKVKQERVKAYENKKSKKPALVAKSSVVLDVKPWSDETDMKELEIAVRKIQMDGLTWGASKLVPLAYGILKLQIIATVVDDKVSVDGLQESIEEIEDLVQSVDIAAFNKL